MFLIFGFVFGFHCNGQFISSYRLNDPSTQSNKFKYSHPNINLNTCIYKDLNFREKIVSKIWFQYDSVCCICICCFYKK